ncbi:hypothetical protein GCM10009566_45920 [Streptomyces murinus]
MLAGGVREPVAFLREPGRERRPEGHAVPPQAGLFHHGADCTARTVQSNRPWLPSLRTTHSAQMVNAARAIITIDQTG